MMTGHLSQDENGEVVRIQSSPIQKWVAGVAASLLVILIVAVVTGAVDWIAFKKSWANYETEIIKNTAARNAGPRVTPKDLEDHIEHNREENENTRDMITNFITLNGQINQSLNSISESLGVIKTKVENTDDELDRVRDQIDNLKRGQP